MKTKEVKELVVGACKSVLLQFSKDNKVETDQLNLRIDLETIKAKPVFALFKKSEFFKRCSLKDVIHAGGGKGLDMIVGTFIKKSIRDIFKQTMKQLPAKDSKELFMLLFLKEYDGELEPTLAVYHNKEFIWSMLIGEAIEAAP